MSFTPNQNPEQVARDAIDEQLRASGWAVQNKDAWNHHECDGQAVREYSTDTGPADYVLFVDGQPVGVIEAKKETLGANITTVEEQSSESAAAKPCALVQMTAGDSKTFTASRPAIAAIMNADA